jgi:hypothetical protein
MLWPFGIFYGNLKYFMAIWYILWPLVNLRPILLISPRFGILNKEKSGNPDNECQNKENNGSDRKNIIFF